MLRKFVTIKNVGNFRSHASSGDTDCRRFTLVHAENARGKTTLCAVLRSLRDGDPTLILERKTLDTTDAPHVKLLFESGTIEFKDSLWSAPCPNLEIFDADFVRANVYSGDSITHDHKRNLCRVVLGKAGVKFAQTLDLLDDDERAAGVTLTKAKSEVLTIVPKGTSIDTFIGLPLDGDIDSKTEEKTREIAIASNAEAVRSTPELKELILPSFAVNLRDKLAKSVESISADAAEKVRNHILDHLGSMRGPETWLSIGLSFADATCPFCAQPLDTSPIFDAMRVFFSTAYRDFQTELDLFAKSVRHSFDSEALLAVQKTVSSNAALLEFWKTYSREAPPATSFEIDIQPVIMQLRLAVEPLVERKLNAPLEPISLSLEAELAIIALEALKTKTAGYNSRVRSFNDAIAIIKRDAHASNLSTLRSELSLLEAQKRRHSPEFQPIISAYGDAHFAKTSLELKKEQARQALDDYNVSVIKAYHHSVNKLLDRFGASFRLLTVKVEYTGRTPRAAYTFGIRGKPVEPGNDRTAPGTPCFRNTLSAGDKSTLALAFFIAQLNNHPDLSNLIVVFDDPFTSLDSFRQHWTCCTIRKIATSAKQVLVLSHSLDFLRMLADRYQSSTLRTLQIARRNAIDSHLIGLDLSDATASQIAKDIIQLRDYNAGEHTDTTATMRCIRPVVENFIRKMAPDDCPEGNGWLGTFVGKIQTADDVSPLAIFKPMYDDLDNLNSYTSPYAHDSGISPSINSAELDTHVQITLNLIGRP